MNYYEVLNLARRLKQSHQPGQTWLLKTRRALTAKMAAEPLGPAALESWAWGWRPAGAVLGATLLVLAAAGTSMVLAAQNELPGGTLYGVKLFLEEVQTLRAPTPVAKAQVALDHAKKRLKEARQLTEQKPDPAALKVALEVYQNNLNTVNSQLLDLQHQGKTEEAKAVASAVSESAIDHKDALKALEASTAAVAAAAPALASAEKAAEASDQLAGKVLIQLNLMLPPAEAAPKAKAENKIGRPAEEPPAEATPSAQPAPKEEIVTPTTPAERAYKLALTKYGDAALRYRQFLNALAKAETGLEAMTLADLAAQAAAAGDILKKADAAWARDDLVAVYDFSSRALIALIDAEMALRAALPKTSQEPAAEAAPAANGGAPLEPTPSGESVAETAGSANGDSAAVEPSAETR